MSKSTNTCENCKFFDEYHAGSDSGDCTNPIVTGDNNAEKSINDDDFTWGEVRAEGPAVEGVSFNRNFGCIHFNKSEMSLPYLDIVSDEVKDVYDKDKDIWISPFDSSTKLLNAKLRHATRQLFLPCSACDGKGSHYDAGEGIEDWCEHCLRSGKILIIAPLSVLEEITELLKVDKPEYYDAYVHGMIESKEVLAQRDEVKEYNQAQNRLNQIIEGL